MASSTSVHVNYIYVLPRRTMKRTRGNTAPVFTGSGQLVSDAWGVQKISRTHSLFHGMWTFDIPPSMWFVYENGVQVYSSTRVTSVGGAARIAADSTVTLSKLESRECARYQPNRGHLLSTALWCPSKTASGVREWGLGSQKNRVNFRLKSDGLLYAVRRSDDVEIAEEPIDTSGLVGFDVEKNNIYDIQFQWRGAGNYNFFIGNPATGTSHLVHQFNLLGTLTSASIVNPAMPVFFSALRVGADVELFTACADVSSENGSRDTMQPFSAYAFTVNVNGTNFPVIAVRLPLQFQSKTNTRTAVILRCVLVCSKKGTFRLWTTRDPAALTGATFAALGNGSIAQCDSPDAASNAVRATSVTTTSLRGIASVPVEAAVPRHFVNSIPETFVLSLVRGDYLVITCTALAATADVVVEWGEAV